MRPNKLRELLNADKPSIGTRVHSTWPSVVEAIGHTGMFDYVEFLAEYAPFDLYALDNFCRAAELFNMTAVIKVDQEPRGFLAQRGVGSGFQGVLFADCRSVEEARYYLDGYGCTPFQHRHRPFNPVQLVDNQWRSVAQGYFGCMKAWYRGKLKNPLIRRKNIRNPSLTGPSENHFFLLFFFMLVLLDKNRFPAVIGFCRIIHQRGRRRR